MLRVTTLYASSAGASAAYYTRYLADAPGEESGRWLGRQAHGLGVAGRVQGDDLQLLLEGRHPSDGTSLGSALVDRPTSDGRLVRAVAGFDATFSAPKSLSVWWALTGDSGLLEAHDLAVAAALEHLERYGATTRIRHQHRRLHPDTLGLTMATFRQTTSRADDPQLHTHAVISAKVQTVDGRWRALDARFLKRHQRMLGGLYQSVLRAELTHRYGIAWGPIVNGQAEIVGMPEALLAQFSKRTLQVDAALATSVEKFRAREGRDPTRWERAAMTREAAADTRTRKSGQPAVDLFTQWRSEAHALGWTAERLTTGLITPAHEHDGAAPVIVEQVLDHLSAAGSTWTRAEVLRVVCDLAPPQPGMSGRQWAAALDRLAGEVLERCVDLDPDSVGTRRASDGRSLWLEPTSPHFTSPSVLAEEERILTWAMDAEIADPARSATIDRDGLDVLQAEAAAAVAGEDRLVVVVGPAGTGKTTMLRAAADDLRRHGRTVFGVAPTAKAAQVLADETGVEADTVAKLLHEWTRGDRLPDRRYQLPVATTLVIDEAGMLGTGSLHHLTRLAEHLDWRLVLVGDHRQLQAVGRGGLFTELCATSRTHELVRIHRFTHQWEAAASLQLRAGDLGAIDAYEAHGRITPGSFDDQLGGIAQDWLALTGAGRTLAISASSNQHVDTLNHTIQHVRLAAGQLDSATATPIAGGEQAHVGEMVVTRRNDRHLTTNIGETVHNRETWIVTGSHSNGALTVIRTDGRGTVRLPADYVAESVRLGYAATEHGHQGDTVDVGIALASPATTHRGLYVATTRGRNENRIHVITETNDMTQARDVLDAVLAHDRADVPAVTQRRLLAQAAGPQPRTETDDLVPGWFRPWREQIAQQRQQLLDGTANRQERRATAAEALHQMQPELREAMEAWEPYARPIRQLERDLNETLRPATRQASHDARHAGLGHRRTAERRAAHANDAVQEAEAAIAAIRAKGAPREQHLDRIQQRADTLQAEAELPAWLDDHNRRQVQDLDQVIDATDTYMAWTDGRPVPSARLAHAVKTLQDVARHAPNFADDAGTIDKTRWYQLLDVAPAIPEHDLRQRRTPDVELQR